MRTVKEIEDVVVIVETDTGHTGYGSAPATAVITGDTHGSIIEAIKKFISPALIGRDIAELNNLTNSIQGAIVRNFNHLSFPPATNVATGWRSNIQAVMKAR